MAGVPTAADPIEMRKAVQMGALLKGEGRLRDGVLIQVCAGMGLRIQDCLNLNWEKVLDDRGEPRSSVTLVEEKTGHSRLIVLFPFVRDALQELRAATGSRNPSGYVFDNGKGAPITRQYAWQLIRKAAEGIGLRAHVSPHSLRKAFCTLIYEQTRDPVLTASITGHRNPVQLMAYIGLPAQAAEDVWHKATLVVGKFGR